MEDRRRRGGRRRRTRRRRRTWRSIGDNANRLILFRQLKSIDRPNVALALQWNSVNLLTSEDYFIGMVNLSASCDS